MECGNNSNLQKLVLSLLQPIKEDPERLIVKQLKQDQMKMYYTAKGLLPMVSKMLRMNLDPEQFILSLVDKLESLPNEKWNILEIYLIRVIQGDEEAINEIKKLLEV